MKSQKGGGGVNGNREVLKQQKNLDIQHKDMSIKVRRIFLTF